MEALDLTILAAAGMAYAVLSARLGRTVSTEWTETYVPDPTRATRNPSATSRS